MADKKSPLAQYSSLDQLAMRPDPVIQYLGDMSRKSIGDAGASVGKAGLAGGVGFGSAPMTGPLGPILGSLLAAGYTADAIRSAIESTDFDEAAKAFKKTGMPGAPMGPAMPLPHQDMRVGRYASPSLVRR